MTKISTPIALAFLFCISPALANPLTINGRVLSAGGEPLPGAEIQLGNRSVSSDKAGHFSLPAGPSDVYALRFSASGHYPMIHSFSSLELAWQAQSSSNETVVPDVTLVEHAQGRTMLMFGGDAMMGRRFSNPPEGDPVLIRKDHRTEDTAALLQFIEPYLQLAEFSSVNLETQILENEPKAHAPKSVVFFSHPQSLKALLDAGIDYVTLGNNHTFDYLDAGLGSTIEALDASGLGWSGAGLNETDALRAFRTTVGGQPISLLGYVGWAGNFTPHQAAQGAFKGGAALGSARNIRNSVRREAAAGFLPVVQYHGSREYSAEPTLVTETRLKQAVDDGAVLAIGHHPHLVQGFEIYNDRLIAYSMGNFLFDQFLSATTRSYLVYAWLDGDRLHRAEVVPIHIKGYVTTPATDTIRQAVLKRVYELSTRRGTRVQASGGHAVIVPGPAGRDQERVALHGIAPTDRPQQVSVWALDGQAWHQPIGSITQGENEEARVLLGQDLLPMGHLESHFTFGAPDRTWISRGPQTIVEAGDAPSGKNVMQLQVPVGQHDGVIGMRTFDRTFRPGTPTTFVAQAKVDAPATVTAYQQWRKRGEDRLEALETAELRAIGQLELTAGDWREIRFDFDSPRVTAFAYRIVLKVSPLDKSRVHRSWFDDIALVEWLTPPLRAGKIPSHVATGQASHAGFWQSPSD